MEKTFITNNSKQTRKLGELLASELRGGEIVCLTGELGSGKTTFAQGILKGLGAEGPYTSPTFVVMKQYKVLAKAQSFGQGSTFPFPDYSSGNSSRSNLSGTSRGQTFNVYHFDIYRVGQKDIIVLGWEEIIAGGNNIVIVEWAERIKSIIPKRAVWIKFGHRGKNDRKITIKSQCQNPNDK